MKNSFCRISPNCTLDTLSPVPPLLRGLHLPGLNIPLGLVASQARRRVRETAQVMERTRYPGVPVRRRLNASYCRCPESERLFRRDCRR